MSKKHFIISLLIFVGLVSACSGSKSPEVTQLPNQSPTQLGITTPEIDLYQTPDWFKDSLLYLVYPRSFYDSDGDGVGDIAGVTEKIDYIQSLGVDTIWLMPIYPSPSDHGYDVTDFFSVNPEYGTLQDLQGLVREVHKREMHILLDFVPSHLSNQNPIFQQAYRNPDSEYSDWFVWTNEVHSQYAGFANLSEMPRFNHYNPAVVDYLSEAALFWLDLDADGDYTDGVDGFRIDNATFPPQEFFFELRDRVKEANPDALLLGETWVNTPSDLSRFFVGQFDALFDFPFYSLLEGNQNFNSDGLLAGKSSPVLLSILIQDEITRFPQEAISVRFLNNHDTNRIATEVDGDMDRMKLAPIVLASFPGVSLIYYGEEIGMFGQKGGPPSWDNYRREPMDWYVAEAGSGQPTWFAPEDRSNKPNDGISVEEQEQNEESLLNHYRQIFKLRSEYTVLTSGAYSPIDLQIQEAGPWGMLRELGDEKLLVLINFSSAPQQVLINDYPLDSTEFRDLISGSDYSIAQTDGEFMIELPAASGLWLEPKKP